MGMSGWEVQMALSDDIDKLRADLSQRDASIAELERQKRVLWQRLHDLDESLTNQLPYWRGTKSHDEIVELLTEYRTS